MGADTVFDPVIHWTSSPFESHAMSVTTTGAQFKAFYSDPKVWGQPNTDEDWYVEDLFLMVNGQDDDMDTVHDRYGDSFERLPDDATVLLEGGDLCWQGRGAAPPREHDDIVRAFKAWDKARTVVSVMATFELPVAWSDEQRARVVDVLEVLGATRVVGASNGGLDDRERAALAKAMGAIVGVDLTPPAASPDRKRPSPR